MIKIIIIFLGLAILNYLFIINKDDDIAEKLITRKPTPQESVRRIRYVITRMFSALFGGGIIAMFSAKYIIIPLHILNRQDFSKNVEIMSIWFCSFIALFILRIFQNIIRKLQGRPPRSFIDIVTIKRNIVQFRKPR